MQHLVTLETTALAWSADIRARAATQRRVVSTMQPCNPSLPYAHSLLLEMEQNAVLAELNHVLASFNAGQVRLLDRADPRHDGSPE